MTTAIILGTELAYRKDHRHAFESEDGVDGAFTDDGTMQWHDALYFTVVTLSTVG